MKVGLKEVFEYIREREPNFREVDWVRAEPIIRWYAFKELLFVVAEEGRVTGAAILRRVKDRETGGTEYAHDEAAPLLWVDCVAADSPRHFASLLDGVTRRWPDNPPVEIHGIKARHGDIPRALNFARFAQKLQHL